MIDQKRTRCILCGNTDIESLFTVENSRLAHCPSCGLEFLSPLPDQSTLDAIYKDYYAAWDLDHASSEVSAMKKRTFQNVLGRLPQSFDSGRLLDVGCATGEMLSVANERGFDVYGVEISPKGKELCRERFGANKILGKPLERGDFPANFFSLVTLCDVIEHIPDPADLLATISHILEPGGLLIVITPDTASWTHAIWGRKWPHYKTEHLHYFNRTNLARLCADHFAVLTAERAYKFLTIGYMASVTNAYSHTAIARLSARLSSLLPCRWRTKAFKLSIGEMLMILRKKADVDQ